MLTLLATASSADSSHLGTPEAILLFVIIAMVLFGVLARPHYGRRCPHCGTSGIKGTYPVCPRCGRTRRAIWKGLGQRR